MSDLRCKCIVLDVWKWEGLAMTGGTEPEFVGFARRLVGTGIEEAGSSKGRAYAKPGCPWLLWVESLDDVPELAHEALHITAGILEMRGLKHAAESEEAYTYTMEHILRHVLDRDGWQPASAYMTNDDQGGSHD